MIDKLKVQDYPPELLKELRAAVIVQSPGYDIVEICAAGSRVQGLFHDKSDYDIAVYASNIKEWNYRSTTVGRFHGKMLTVKYFPSTDLPYRLVKKAWDLPLYSLITGKYHAGKAEDLAAYLHRKTLHPDLKTAIIPAKISTKIF